MRKTRPTRCPQCEHPELEPICEMEVTVLTVGEVPGWRVWSCAVCNWRERVIDCLRYGLWPISPRLWVFIPFSIMELMATQANFNPLVSNTTLVNSLNFLSRKHQHVSSHAYKSKFKRSSAYSQILCYVLFGYGTCTGHQKLYCVVMHCCLNYSHHVDRGTFIWFRSANYVQKHSMRA